jgi:hypothetical protein
MRTIIRCPACFTYVYSDARRCHGCGERIGKRKILRRGSWVFIILAVTGFTFARGIELHQESRDRSRRQLEIAAEVDVTKSFLRSWLTSSGPDEIKELSETKTFPGELVKLRQKFPDVLPATRVTSIKIADDARRSQLHEQRGREPVVHLRDDSSYSLRASACHSGDEVRRKPVYKTSWLHAYEFEADFVSNDRPYTAYGQACIRDGKVCCLALDRIEAEGIEDSVVVKPR